MSLRRVLSVLVEQNQLGLNALLTTRWNEVLNTPLRHRSLHIRNGHGFKPNVQKATPESTCYDVINQMIPLHELENPRTVTLDDWRSNRDSFKDARMFRSVLQELGRRKLFDAGKSYIEMIRKYEPQMLSPFNEIYVLRFLIHCNPGFEICSDEQDVQYIQETYSKLKKAFPVLEYFSAETLVLAMQRTPKWKDALELIDDLSFAQKPKAIVYSSIIINALKDNDKELAWSFINKIKELYLCPHDECWIEWLHLCRRLGITEWKDGVGRMLEDFYLHHMHMSCTVADEMMKFIDELCPEYIVQRSVIEQAHCRECSTKLNTEFSSTDHTDLKEMVEKIINHDSLYASTTPAEMQKFKRFIENCSSYDVVIDGLNAMYSRRGISLHDITKLKKKLKARILFLGRIHLAQKKEFRQIANLCQVFLCENLSRDDVYVLYAAIYHSTNVKFASDDKMRSQFYYLAEDLRRNLFLRWQYMNQLELKRAMELPTYLPEIHKAADGTYHIPCVAESSTDLSWSPANAQFWLCVRPAGLSTRTKKGAKPTNAMSSEKNSHLIKPDTTLSSQVNADGSTIVDDLVERLHSSKQFSKPEFGENCEENVRVRVNLEDESVRDLIKGFQSKYRYKARNTPKNSSSWISNSLCQREIKDEVVVDNLRKRFKQMTDSKKSPDKSPNKKETEQNGQVT